jgi:hypothetical protein
LVLCNPQGVGTRKGGKVADGKEKVGIKFADDVGRFGSVFPLFGILRSC